MKVDSSELEPFISAPRKRVRLDARPAPRGSACRSTKAVDLEVPFILEVPKDLRDEDDGEYTPGLLEAHEVEAISRC